MTRLPLRATPVAIVLLGTVAGAQQVPDAHQLGAVTGTITEAFGGVQGVRQLPDGRLLVNDPGKRRLLLFEAGLDKFTVIADSTNPAATYSGRIAGLVAYRGDSTLFVDPQSLSMLVIDPKGQVGRVMAVPRAEDAMALTGIAFGVPGFDAQGRLVYRAQPRFEFRRQGAPGGGGPNGLPFTPPTFPDTSPILRVDLATRKVDTVAFLKSYSPKMQMTPRENGGFDMSSVINPLPLVDDWAVLNDGTIVILRGREFRADLVGTDGKLVAGPKVTHDWQRMNDEEKAAFLDSTRIAMEKQRAEMQQRIQAAGGVERMISSGGGPMGGGGAGVPMISIRVDGPGGGEPPRRGNNNGGPSANGANTNGAPQMPKLEFIPASDLPDYKPPFSQGATRPDADGNLWVRLIATKPMPGPVYDIIDKEGKLVDRVVLPANSAIAGFGPGVVYLATRDNDGTHLKRVKVR